MENIIEIKNISKYYKINHIQTGYYTLREKLNELIKNPIRFFLKIRKEMFNKNKKEEFWALKNINLSINKGDVVGIIGKNGAGKSTLLKILSKITPPTNGEIKIKGTIGSLLEIGTGFHPELTGRENIFLNGIILGMKKKDIVKKFDQIVEFAGIEKFLDTPVKHYSSGMYVRLAFSIAAYVETDILIIDEVLAVGDTEFQKKCLGMINNITQNQNRTIIFVSHNLNAITNICNKCILLEKGEVVFWGETQKCIQKYTSNEKTNGLISFENKNMPGNEFVKIKEIKIESEMKTQNIINMDENILITIKYENSKKNNIFSNSIHIKDSSGNYVLASLNTPSETINKENWYKIPRDIGFYTSTCKIPANLLNTGTYSIDVGIINSRIVHEFILPDMLFFTITDSNKMKREYTGELVGVIRPKLEWYTKSISN